MLSIVLDLPHNLEILTRCLSMVSVHAPSTETEVVVPWEDSPKEIVSVMKAFSSRFYWKVVLCPKNSAGYLPAVAFASSPSPIVMSHTILLDKASLAILEKVKSGRARVYKADNFPLQYDPYSFWIPDNYKEYCLTQPHQTPDIQVHDAPLCFVGGGNLPFVDADVLMLGEGKMTSGIGGCETKIISSTDKVRFPPDENYL